MAKKAGDLGIYHCRSRIRPGNGWKKLLLRAFCNAHRNQSGGLGGYVCVPLFIGMIVLLNTARMEKYAQLLAQKRRGLKVEGLARNRSAA
jgi:hypothetical protein